MLQRSIDPNYVLVTTRLAVLLTGLTTLMLISNPHGMGVNLSADYAIAVLPSQQQTEETLIA